MAQFQSRMLRWKFQKAREMRKAPTYAEALLWSHLKGKRLNGRGWRRQHPCLGYILDFYCPSKRLAVELDGDGHDSEADEIRDIIFLQHDIRTLRFTNRQMINNTEMVLELIRNA